MDTNRTMNGSVDFVNASGDSINHEANIAFAREYILWRYNEKLFEANKPVMAFLVFMVVLGVFGNSAVVYIYSVRFKRNTVNFFILLLGIFDVIAASMLSFEALDRRFPMYSGQIPVLCKIVRVIECNVTTWSIAILVCIAFDRYYKICHPMKSFTMGKAKKFGTVGILIGCTAAWPIAIFHGAETAPTGIPGVNGLDCADDDAHKDKVIVPLYYAALMIINVICFTMLFVLYTLLYKEIWRWKHKRIGEDIKKIMSKSVRTISEFVEDTDSKHIQFSETDVVIEFGSEVMGQDESSGLNEIKAEVNPQHQHNDVQDFSGICVTAPPDRDLVDITPASTDGNALGNIRAPQDGNVLGNTRAPQDGNALGNTQAPQDGNALGNTQAPQDGNALGNSRAPQDGNALGNSRAPQDVDVPDIFSPHDRSSDSNCNSLSEYSKEEFEHNNKTCQDSERISNMNIQGSRGYLQDQEIQLISYLNTAISSCESDQTDCSKEQNLTNQIPDDNPKTTSHAYVTRLTIGKFTDSKSQQSVNSSPKKTDTINTTKLTNVMDEQGSQRHSKSPVPETEKSSVISHFSSMSSAFRKKFSSRQSFAKPRSPKSAASLAHSTFLFTVITAAFVLSYIPYFIIEILHAAGILDINADMSLLTKQILRIANSSFCINTAINPVIYSILNPAFKKELKIIFLGTKAPPKRTTVIRQT